MARKPRIEVDVVVRDRGWRKLLREAKKRGAHVTVGIHGSEDNRIGGIGNVELATVHEFGSERAGVPERSFIRATIDRQETNYFKIIRGLGDRVLAGTMTVESALEILGAKVAADMRNTIGRRATVPRKPLADSTLAARSNGGNIPLLDRGDLQRAIKHKVST